MTTFNKGCVVVHRPTKSLYRVLRSISDDSLLLLEPFFEIDREGGCGWERRGTRWAFEKEVVFLDMNKYLLARALADARNAARRSKRESARKASLPATPSDQVGGGTASGEGPDRYRHISGLDPRFIFRQDSARPGRGRGTFALEPVARGTEIMRAPAMVAVVNTVYKREICSICFMHMHLVQCPECKYRFCLKCQAQWRQSSTHKATCRFAISVERTPLARMDADLLRLAADLLIRKKCGLFSDMEWELWNTLESQRAGTVSERLEEHTLQDAWERLRSLVGLDVSMEDVQTVYWRLGRNTHQFSLMFGRISIATGMFPGAALVNHACRPNSVFHAAVKHSADGPVVEYVLRAVHDIDEGEEVLCSYLQDIGQDFQERREVLHKAWGFLCNCEACQHEANQQQLPKLLASDKEALTLLERSRSIQETPSDVNAPESARMKEFVEDAAKFLNSTSDISSYAKRLLAFRTCEIAVALKNFEQDSTPASNSILPLFLSATTRVFLQDAHVSVNMILTLIGHWKLAATNSLKIDSDRKRSALIQTAYACINHAIWMARICYGEEHRNTKVICSFKDRFINDVQALVEGKLTSMHH